MFEALLKKRKDKAVVRLEAKTLQASERTL